MKCSGTEQALVDKDIEIIEDGCSRDKHNEQSFIFLFSVKIQTKAHLFRAAICTQQPELTIFLELYLISCKQNMSRESGYIFLIEEKKTKAEQKQVADL